MVPLLAEERARKREDLLRATEALLDPIAAAARRDKRRLKGADKIGLRAGKVVGKCKMAYKRLSAVARLPQPEDRGPEGAARVPPNRLAGARACVPVHAGLLGNL